jgi:uncharacterized membrane protein YgdD (TMEM256/DUF423 family)
MRIFLILGAISACTGVGMGAFGAHGLKTLLSTEMLAVYKTGVTYQMWHALGLMLIAILAKKYRDNLLIWAAWIMFSGIVLFSGSLYLLTIMSARWLGMITPLGGLAFMIAWMLVAIFAWQRNVDEVE